jgi:hypothetical protein
MMSRSVDLLRLTSLVEQAQRIMEENRHGLGSKEDHAKAAAAQAVALWRPKEAGWGRFAWFVRPLLVAYGREQFQQRLLRELRGLRGKDRLTKEDIKYAREGHFSYMSNAGRWAVAIVLEQEVCRYIQQKLLELNSNVQ